MTVEIIVKQICDRCKESRELNAEKYHDNPKHALQLAGWRELCNKHICVSCIQQIFNGK